MNIFQSFGLVAATVAAIYAIFKAVDESASPAARKAFADWLRSVPATGDFTFTVHSLLRLQILGYFGTSILKKKFVFRSLFLSLASAFVYVLLASSIPLPINPELRVVLFAPTVDWAVAIQRMGFLFAACFVVDYLSLGKTILILQAVDFHRNYFRYYIVDIVISVLMGLGWMIAVSGMAYVATSGKLNNSTELATALLTSLTALTPTALGMLFLFSSALLKLVSLPLRRMLPLSYRILDIEGHPFLSAGVTCSLVTAFAGVLLIALFRY